MIIQEAYHNVWKKLGDKSRRMAAAAFFEKGDHPDLTCDLKRDLAKVLKFRPETVQKLPPTNVAEHLSLRLKDERLHKYIEIVLVDYFLNEQVEMLSVFLDELGIDHEKGKIEVDFEAPSKARLIKAISAIAIRFPEEEVEGYLSTLYMCNGSGPWANLPEAIEELVPEVSARRAEVSDPNDLPELEDTPESSEVFTTLDNWLIKTAVASAAGEIGALGEDELFDLVDEVTALNADRRRSYFHRGFFDALFDREFTFSFRGENAERRAWYLRGVFLGLLRSEKREDCLKIINQEAALVREVAESGHTPCGAELLPLLYSTLIDGKKFTLCRNWTSSQIRRLDVSRRTGLLNAIYDDAADLVRGRRCAEAILLLEILVPNLQNDSELPEDFVDYYMPQALRKLAQSHQGQGNFAVAEKQLEKLVSDPNFHLQGAVLTDLGLIRSGLRGLADIAPRNTPEKSHALLESLEKGESLFRDSVKEYGENATNAHLVLGIMGILRGADHTDTTVTHLQQARTGMLSNQGAYESGDLHSWAAACLGLGLLESADPANYQRAADLTRQAIDSDVIFPLDLWERFLRAASMFDDSSLAAEIAERLLDLRGSEACIAIRASGVLRTDEELRERFIKSRSTVTLPAEEKWSDWEAVLISAMEGQSWGQAEIALDQLEVLAEDNGDLRTRFCKLVTDGRESWSPVWEESDVENVVARIHEVEGRNAEACGIFESRFYRLKAGGAPYQLEEADQLIDKIRSLGANLVDIDSLADQLRAAREAFEEPGERDSAKSRLRSGESVSLIYIGGNEIQAKCEERILSRLQKDWPGIEVEFHFPGWGSNWAPKLDVIEARLGEVNAVVLSYLVRTNCGRRVRRMCEEIPWFACTGKGSKSIEAAIRQAAIWSVGNG